jgi:hypothetical protein
LEQAEEVLIKKTDNVRKKDHEKNIWPYKQWRTEGGFWGFKHSLGNSEVLLQLSSISNSVEYTSVTT